MARSKQSERERTAFLDAIKADFDARLARLAADPAEWVTWLEIVAEFGAQYTLNNQFLLLMQAEQREMTPTFFLPFGNRAGQRQRSGARRACPLPAPVGPGQRGPGCAAGDPGAAAGDRGGERGRQGCRRQGEDRRGRGDRQDRARQRRCRRGGRGQAGADRRGPEGDRRAGATERGGRELHSPAAGGDRRGEGADGGHQGPGRRGPGLRRRTPGGGSAIDCAFVVAELALPFALKGISIAVKQLRFAMFAYNVGGIDAALLALKGTAINLRTFGKLQKVALAARGRGRAILEGFTSCLKNGHSFAAGTGVLMADGSVKAIEDVRVGDRVRNATPGGMVEMHRVTQVHVTLDDTRFTKLTVAAAGARSPTLGRWRSLPGGQGVHEAHGQGELPIVPKVPATSLNNAGETLLDDILTDPHSQFIRYPDGRLRVISNSIVSPWAGAGKGKNYFIGVTFRSDGSLHYFGVYK